MLLFPLNSVSLLFFWVFPRASSRVLWNICRTAFKPLLFTIIGRLFLTHHPNVIFPFYLIHRNIKISMLYFGCCCLFQTPYSDDVLFLRWRIYNHATRFLWTYCCCINRNMTIGIEYHFWETLIILQLINKLFLNNKIIIMIAWYYDVSYSSFRSVGPKWNISK